LIALEEIVLKSTAIDVRIQNTVNDYADSALRARSPHRAFRFHAR